MKKSICKKVIPVVMAVFSIIIFVGCNSKTTQKTKYYDEQYIKTLAISLDDRWEYSESKSAKDADLLDSLTKALTIEYDGLKKGNFSEKKFKNSKLKELALSYNNELKNGIEILKKATKSSLYESDGKWAIHYNNRTKLLSEINEVKGIPVKNKTIFKELINNGSEVKENKELEDKIETNLSKIVFSEKPKEYESSYKDYEAVVINETGTNFKSFSAKIYLEDESGTRVDTEYIYLNDWATNQKVTVDFSTDKVFSTLKIVKDYFTVEK
ncbi:MAG: hypothetical protein LBS41_03965 [Streptococcaceae bacterium]|jgi:hypothetical protein|nr:hypothetical protein [Streptococcaceae bacterium]